MRVFPTFPSPVVLVLLFGVGCAQSPQAPPASPKAALSAPATCDRAHDQKAILAMAGSYHVEFTFEETTPLTAGYEPRVKSKSGATELVIVLEDKPGRVSLQYVLVVGAGGASKDGNVVKHWRQDWAFEPDALLEFQGRRSWLRRSLPSGNARCAWTQAVFEVDDSPRYEGHGRWTHDAKGSVWESNQTWRPLPRREYTKRSDYDVLVGVNRHRITAAGWDHEQDNVKLVLSPRHELVRERGLNRYTRVDANETLAAASYWQTTSAFWQAVREEWARALAPRAQLELRTEVDGKRLYEPLFERAEAKPSEVDGATSAFIQEVIARYLAPAPDAFKSPTARAEGQESNGEGNHGAR